MFFWNIRHTVTLDGFILHEEKKIIARSVFVICNFRHNIGNIETTCHTLPHPKQDAVQRALDGGLTCAGPHCGGRFPHWVLDPEGEAAEHQAESSSGQIYCKPSCHVECHQLTWTFASDHPGTCKTQCYIQWIQKETHRDIVQLFFWA